MKLLLYSSIYVQGAREFIVPTRTLGQFYSLTQSPQQVILAYVLPFKVHN